jgi:outer membrane protein OmpA-like peptidoglycan-associated protein
VAEHCSIGAGVQLTIPNGPKNKGLSRGELGETPFISTRYEHGPFAVGLNAGYEIYSGNAVDVFDYGAEAIVRGSETWAFRTELAGRVFKDGGHSFDALQLLPGIDFNLSPNLTVRPQGMAGLTNSAIDWGVGAGLAFTFPVPALWAAPPPPPPPTPAAAEPPPAPVKEKIVLRGVHFDFNKANIRADAKPTLDEAAATLKDHGSIAITVEGHTDSVGSEAYNQKLSVRRAAAVRDYLAGQGVDASRMTVVGKGKADPVASNDTADGRAQNRRVELVVKE